MRKNTILSSIADGERHSVFSIYDQGSDINYQSMSTLVD